MNENNEANLPKRKFNLLTTVAMIIGIVIGSGIFFKTPQIIKATQGNILLGAVAFGIAAISIIFGGITIAQYASHDENVGGIISYCESAWGKTAGYLAGWFQMVFYYPAIIGVISWVAACYTLGLLGYDNLLTNGQFNGWVWPVAFAYLLGLYVLNTLSTKNAGHFQTISMFIKILALVFLGGIGLLFGKPAEIITQASQYPHTTSGLFGALIAVIFAFDGWTNATSIAHEIKNPKKNLVLALILAPIAITTIYLLYYLGVSAYVGPELVLAGQDPLGILAMALLGNLGMKLVYLCVIISVLGTLNGLILGYIRLPYALALRNSLPGSKTLCVLNKKLDIPVNSSVCSFLITLVWLILHWCSLDGAALHHLTLFQGLEVDSLPIVMTYFFYILLYLGIMLKPHLTLRPGIHYRYLFPLLAILGSLIVLYGGLTKPQFNVYLIISLIGIIAGLLIRPKEKTNANLAD